MKEEIKQPESGRTMVEMLGTLAIIGILSIGGVTGYGRAITAHRANAAIEAAQREAAIVAGDVATGQKVEPSNATVLRSPSGYEVAVRDVTGGTSDIVTTTPFFGVEVGGGNGQAVQRNVAKSIVERAVEDWTNVHGIGVISGEGANRTIKWLTSAGSGANGFESEVPENTQTVIIIIVYATDLSPRADDLLTDFALPVDPNTCDPECNVCSQCQEGQCVADSDKDGTQECTTANNEEGICNAGECVSTSTDNCPSGTTVEEGYTGANALADGKCICNDYATAQCGLGYYCRFSPSSCSASGDGVCKPITGGTEVTPAGDTTKTYLKGPNTDWWSAYSWCIGNGKHSMTGTMAGHALDNWRYSHYGADGDIYTYLGKTIYFWTGYGGSNPCTGMYAGAASDSERVAAHERHKNYSSYGYSIYALCE